MWNNRRCRDIFSRLCITLRKEIHGSLLFITQTEVLAMSRNTDTDKTGNRIYYEILVDDIERYGVSLITCPVGVLGVYLNE